MLLIRNSADSSARSIAQRRRPLLRFGLRTDSTPTGRSWLRGVGAANRCDFCFIIQRMNPPDLTVSLYTAEQVRRIDRTAIETCGIAGFELMQRAADAVFATLRRRWPDARRIAVLAGRGNNGGDALLVGRLALEHGLDVDAFAMADATVGDAGRARDTFVGTGGRTVSF